MLNPKTGKVFPVRKLELGMALITIVGMSSDFQISVVKGFLEFHLPSQPLEIILDWYSFLCTLQGFLPLCDDGYLWRLVCRGLTESIKLPVVGILYLSSWYFAFVQLAVCICPAGILYFVQLLVLRPAVWVMSPVPDLQSWCATDGHRWHT